MLVELGKAFKDAFLALYLINTGVNKEVLKGKEKEVKDAKKAAKLKNHIESLPDSDVDSGLRKPKK